MKALQIDLLSISVLGIFVLLGIIAVMIYWKFLRQSKGAFTVSPIDNDILNALEKLRQEIASKSQIAETPDAFLNEVKKLHEEMESRFKELGTSVSVLNEVEKLRQDFDVRFGAKFSNQAFTSDDAFAFFYAVSNSLERFDHDISSEPDVDVDVIREAQGYVAILRLIISWAQANGRDGIKTDAEEYLNAAQRTLEKAKAT